MHAATDDYARTLNAGFCAVVSASLLQGTVAEWQGPSAGLPLVAPYLLLPLALNEETAFCVKVSHARGLQEFLHRHPWVLAGFESLARLLVPYVRAGLGCALRRGALAFDRRSNRLFPTGALDGSTRRLDELLGAANTTAVAASRKVGRWASAISFAYVCSLVSCRPVLRERNYA